MGTYFLIGALVLLIVALVGPAIYLYTQTEDELALDDETLCPTGGPSQTTAIIVDATDSIGDITRLALMNNLRGIIERIPKYGQITLYVIDANGAAMEPAFKFCNPGKLEDLTELARMGIIANQEFIRRRWEDYRSRTLAEIERALDRSFEADRSPLLHAIQLVTVQLPQVRQDLDPDNRLRNRIVMFSDMLEHTQDFSVYRSGIDIEAFRQSNAYRKYTMDLKPFVMEVHFVMRTESGARNLSEYVEIRNFWHAIFVKEFKAYDMLPMRLPGAN